MKIIKACKAFLKALETKQVQANISLLPPNELLVGRTALITGGTSGIGLEIARAFINAGATAIITGRDDNRVKNACQKIEDSVTRKNHVRGLVFDVSDVDSMEQRLNEAVKISECNHIDILVNNAGVVGAHIANATEKDFNNVMNTNLRGAFFLSKVFARYMINNGIQGNILNISSSSALRPAVSAYTLTKWGVRGLTLGLGKMFAPYGIVVNAIAPGQTATRMIQRENDKDLFSDTVPCNRVALPEEIANMAVIMVSDMCRLVIGDTLYMTGGSGIVANDDMSYDFE